MVKLFFGALEVKQILFRLTKVIETGGKVIKTTIIQHVMTCCYSTRTVSKTDVASLFWHACNYFQDPIRLTFPV